MNPWQSGDSESWCSDDISGPLSQHAEIIDNIKNLTSVTFLSFPPGNLRLKKLKKVTLKFDTMSGSPRPISWPVKKTEKGHTQIWRPIYLMIKKRYHLFVHVSPGSDDQLILLP